MPKRSRLNECPGLYFNFQNRGADIEFEELSRVCDGGVPYLVADGSPLYLLPGAAQITNYLIILRPTDNYHIFQLYSSMLDQNPRLHIFAGVLELSIDFVDYQLANLLAFGERWQRFHFERALIQGFGSNQDDYTRLISLLCHNSSLSPNLVFQLVGRDMEKWDWALSAGVHRFVVPNANYYVPPAEELAQLPSVVSRDEFFNLEDWPARGISAAEEHNAMMNAFVTAKQLRLRDVLETEPKGSIVFVDGVMENINTRERTARVIVPRGQSSLQMYHDWLDIRDPDYKSAWRQGMFEVWKGAADELFFFKAPPVDTIRDLAIRWCAAGPLYTPRADEQRPYHKFESADREFPAFFEFLFMNHPAFCYSLKTYSFRYITAAHKVANPLQWRGQDPTLVVDKEFLHLVQECKHRFVVGVLIIYTKLGSHGNAIVVDTVRRTLSRYEPHGTGLFTMYNDIDLDAQLLKFVNDSKWFLKYVPPKKICPTVGPQSRSERHLEQVEKIKGRRDRGWCAVHTMMFVHLRVSHPELSDYEVSRLMLNDSWVCAQEVRSYTNMLMLHEKADEAENFLRKEAAENENPGPGRVLFRTQPNAVPQDNYFEEVESE